MISIYWRVSRGLSVSHMCHSIRRNTTAAKRCLKLSAKAFSSVDSAPSTQPFGHAQKHVKKRLFFQTLVTILITAFTHFFGDVFCLLPSVFLHKKNERKMRIKTKRWKEEKMNFLPWTFCFWRTSEAKKSEKKKLKKNKRVKGRHWKKRDERWREEKKGERWTDATNVPGQRSMTSECT